MITPRVCPYVGLLTSVDLSSLATSLPFPPPGTCSLLIILGPSQRGETGRDGRYPQSALEAWAAGKGKARPGPELVTAWPAGLG
jgi:hypothetical protein